MPNFSLHVCLLVWKIEPQSRGEFAGWKEFWTKQVNLIAKYPLFFTCHNIYSTISLRCRILTFYIQHKNVKAPNKTLCRLLLFHEDSLFNSNPTFSTSNLNTIQCLMKIIWYIWSRWNQINLKLDHKHEGLHVGMIRYNVDQLQYMSTSLLWSSSVHPEVKCTSRRHPILAGGAPRTNISGVTPGWHEND